MNSTFFLWPLLHIDFKGKSSTPLRVLVERMYGKMDITTKRLVPAILQYADPRQEAGPAPYKRLAAREAVYEQMAFDLDTAQAEVQAFKDAQEDAVTPNNTTDAFMQKMAMAESSGEPNAAIAVEDGRTFKGQWHFGDARLSDYRKPTGAKFTTAEFKENQALQQKVADWHFQDIQDAIEALGYEADGYDRDGLPAVANLVGVSGMSKYVRTKVNTTQQTLQSLACLITTPGSQHE